MHVGNERGSCHCLISWSRTLATCELMRAVRRWSSIGSLLVPAPRVQTGLLLMCNSKAANRQARDRHAEVGSKPAGEDREHDMDKQNASWLAGTECEADGADLACGRSVPGGRGHLPYPKPLKILLKSPQLCTWRFTRVLCFLLLWGVGGGGWGVVRGCSRLQG